MKHLFTLITLLLTIGVNAQNLKFEFNSGFKYEEMTRTYDLTKIGLVGGLIQGASEQSYNVQNEVNRTIERVNQTPLVNIDTINLQGFTNFANKERTTRVTRYLTTASGRASVDGVELIGTLELGVSSALGLSAGGSASIFVNAGLFNWFGFGLEPLEIDTFTELHWTECLAVGYTVRATTESMFFNSQSDKSIDVKVQIPITNDKDRKEKRVNIYLIKSFNLNAESIKGWQGGVTYKL